MYFFLDLDERTPVPCTKDEWLIFLHSPSHSIAQATINQIVVTTLFSGIADPHLPQGSIPALFETTLRGEGHDAEEIRYENREMALLGHQKVCISNALWHL